MINMFLICFEENAIISQNSLKKTFSELCTYKNCTLKAKKVREMLLNKSCKSFLSKVTGCAQ